MPDHPRIEELRRRIRQDPASIAFAQLAEEYRRAGNHQEAVATCRAGLSIHPGYLSVRVTLGRALIELNDLEAAEAELDYVLQRAPENLAAIRGLAEIHHRRGHLTEALEFYQSALSLARHDPDLEQAVEEISRTIAPARRPITDGLSFEQASAEFLSALDNGPLSGGQGVVVAESHEPEPREPTGHPHGIVEAPALPELERFLEAIHCYRRRRAVQGPSCASPFATR